MAHGQPIDRQKLKLARLRKGWTLRDVSQRCAELGTPVDHGNIARYESGQLSPHSRTLYVIARALDLDVGDLLLTEDAANGSAA